MRNVVLFGLLLLAALVPLRGARAEIHSWEGMPNSCASTAAHCSKAFAYSDCMARQNAVDPNFKPANPVPSCTGGTGDSGAWTPYTQGSNGYFVLDADVYDHACDGTATYNETTHQCATPFDSQACLAHNSEPGFVGVGDTTRVGNSYCSGGCDFRPVAASSSGGVVSVGLPQGGTVSRGKWEFTGNACDAAAPAKTPSEITTHNDDPQACTPAGNGQTFCLKKDGEHCASASNGKQICWRATETGTKTSDNVAQVRTSGTNPPTTPPPAPPGDTMNQQTPFTTTTNTTTTGGTTTTNTTTITNYTTASGNDAGSTNCGEAATGTGTSPCQPGTASGGTDCSTPPIATDPQLAMIATQAWATKCATVAGNSVKVTGDVTNCKTPYTVEGVDGGTSPGAVDANAEKLKALRATICGSYNPDGHDSTDAINGSDDGTSLRDSVISEGTAHGADGLDTSGMGFSRTCPTIPMITVYGHQIDLNRPQLCTWMQIGGQFVLLLAALLSLRIMAGGGAPA